MDNHTPAVEKLDPLENQDWYKALVDDIKSDIVETEFSIKQTAIELHHRLGKTISEETRDLTRSEYYGQGLIERLATDVGRSSGDLWMAYQFYRKYPDLAVFLSDKDKTLSWSQVKKFYLPETASLAEPKVTTPLDENKEVEEVYKLKAKFTYDSKTKLYILTIDSEDYDHIDFSKVATPLRSYLKTLN